MRRDFFVRFAQHQSAVSVATTLSLSQRQTEVPQCSSFACVCERESAVCVCVCILESAVQLARRKSEHTYTHTHRHAYYKCLSVWHSTFLYAVHINCIIYVTFMLASRSLAYTLSLSFLFSLSPMALPLTHSDCR